MLSEESVEKIRLLADQVSKREGCLLYDIDFSGHSKNRILRVYIDTANAPVSVEQCANVSRGLSLLLDVEDIIPGGRYDLEVSSPGVERQLRLPWHFQKALGQEVKVVFHEPITQFPGEVRGFTAPIQTADDRNVVFTFKNEAVSVPYENIKRAQVVFQIKRNEKKR